MCTEISAVSRPLRYGLATTLLLLTPTAALAQQGPPDPMPGGPSATDLQCVGCVDTGELADGAVTADKLADGAVTADKLAEDAVITPELADGVFDSLESALRDLDELDDLHGLSEKTVFVTSRGYTGDLHLGGAGLPGSGGGGFPGGTSSASSTRTRRGSRDNSRRGWVHGPFGRRTTASCDPMSPTFVRMARELPPITPA